MREIGTLVCWATSWVRNRRDSYCYIRGRRKPDCGCEGYKNCYWQGSGCQNNGSVELQDDTRGYTEAERTDHPEAEGTKLPDYKAKADDPGCDFK